MASKKDRREETTKRGRGSGSEAGESTMLDIRNESSSSSTEQEHDVVG